MKTTNLIVAFVTMALMVSSPCFAVEPYIQITKAYTTDTNGLETDEFEVGDTVVCRVEFTVVGNEGKNYRVVGMIQALGETEYFKEKYTPDDYMFESSKLVTGQFEPGAVEQCLYKVKVKKGRNGVLYLKDTDSAICEVAILE